MRQLTGDEMKDALLLVVNLISWTPFSGCAVETRSCVRVVVAVVEHLPLSWQNTTQTVAPVALITETACSAAPPASPDLTFSPSPVHSHWWQGSHCLSLRVSVVLFPEHFCCMCSWIEPSSPSCQQTNTERYLLQGSDLKITSKNVSHASKSSQCPGEHVGVCQRKTACDVWKRCSSYSWGMGGLIDCCVFNLGGKEALRIICHQCVVPVRETIELEDIGFSVDCRCLYIRCHQVDYGLSSSGKIVS